MQAGDWVYLKKSRVIAMVKRELWGSRVLVETIGTGRHLVVWKWAVRKTYGKDITRVVP